MELTDAQRKKIWLISDTLLYPEAVTFMHEILEHEDVKQLPKRSQVTGLFEIAESSKYSDVLTYIRNQIDRRIDTVFYERLLQVLNTMERKRLQEEFHFVISQPTTQANKAEKNEIMLFLAREFIKHLMAEHGMLLVEEKKNRERKNKQYA